MPPPPPIVTGTPGISAAKQHGRRAARTDSDATAGQRQAAEAWSKGAFGEERLGEKLSTELDDIAVVLHDRKVPRTRGNIDHLVIAPSGIWIVDAKNYTGKVERRHVGGMFTGRDRLYVNDRNQTKLLDGLDWQEAAVSAVIEPIGFGRAPVHTALCFISSSWGLRWRPIRIAGKVVTWPSDLVKAIRQPGPLDRQVVELLARELSSKLPASG